MSPFDLASYVERSTTASDVPVYVDDPVSCVILRDLSMQPCDLDVLRMKPHARAMMVYSPAMSPRGSTDEQDHKRMRCWCRRAGTRDPLAPRNCLDRSHRSIVAAHVCVMASRMQESSAESPLSGRAVGERASPDPIESGAVAMELHALEFVGERAETFVRGRAAGVEAARRHGPVPDRVADAIATIITGDPAVRAAG